MTLRVLRGVSGMRNLWEHAGNDNLWGIGFHQVDVSGRKPGEKHHFPINRK